MPHKDCFTIKQKAIDEAKTRSEGNKYSCVIKGMDKKYWVESTSFTRVGETLVIQFENGKELK